MQRRAPGIVEKANRSLTDILASWHDFYSVLGEASATLVALLFVAASIASGVFSADRTGPMRIFLSATVVHFSSILAASLLVLAPLGNQVFLGALIVAGGVVGLGYYGVTWRDIVQDGLIKRIDLEDRIWYAYLPVACYLMETATGGTLIMGFPMAPAALAAALGALLLIGIHNAWDITVWSIGQRGQ
jgi:hypothetical protein